MTAAPHLQILRECLHFSVQVYSECSIEDRGTSTQALAGGSLDGPGALIIAFRGSQEPRDYLTDARFLEKAVWPGGGGEARVHRGFSGGWFSVSEKIRARVKKIPRVILTGHSLGAALATLAAIDLAAHGLPVWQVVTFGSPRVGNGAFRDFYNANLHDRTWRVVAQGDPVTALPPWFAGYRHCGRELYLPNAGGYRVEPMLWRKAIPTAQAILNDVGQAKQNHNLVMFGPHAIRNYSQLIERLK